MIEWTDETSYSRRDAERVPRIMVVRYGGIRLQVHRLNGCPDKWFWSCNEVDVSQSLLKSYELEAAKLEAVDRLVVILGELLIQAREIRRDLLARAGIGGIVT